ncbi:hypothetical protein EC991_003818 [Linnemannia zychae]|nr:hypothetical protein EC991_003818 [Linnemannia zychae]
MTVTSLDTLPQEILETVATFLSRQDLTVCIQVSRAWSEAFYPALWRHIDIYLDGGKTRNNKFTDALKSHGNLVYSLKLNTEYDSLFSFIGSGAPTLPNLTSMEIEGSFEFIHDNNLAEIIGMSATGWKKLSFCCPGRIYVMIRFGLKSFEMLLGSVNSLVVVRFDGLSGVEGHHVNTLLCSAPNLKEIYCYSCSRDRIFGPWLDAKTMADSNWICSGLEIFACEIRGIPRPDITRDICGQPARYRVMRGTLVESLALHHQIYAKLGQLVKLRELTLGLPLDSENSYLAQRDQAYYRQFDCLAMTLESGLDLLRGLRNLKMVTLFDMEVYVDGYEEQSWLREHWPNAVVQSTHQSVDIGMGAL